METIMNWTSPYPVPNIVDTVNYDWISQRASLYLVGISSLPIFVLIAGIITFVVKKVTVPVTLGGKQVAASKNVSGKSSIARVPWHVLFKYLWEYKGDIPKMVSSLTDRYGSAWQLPLFGGKNLIFLNNAESLQKLLSGGDFANFKKPSLLYDTVQIGSVKDGLAFSDVTTWKSHRSVLNKAFTYESLRSYVGIFEAHAKQLILTLDTTFGENSSEENSDCKNDDNSFHNIIHFIAFGNILEIVTGGNILNDDEKKLVNKLFERCKELVSYRVYHPWYVMMKWLWKLSPQKKELDRNAAKLEALNKKVMTRTREVIDAKKSTGNTLVELMIRSGLPDNEISCEVATFLLLGHETVSMSTNLLIFNLAVNPDYQKKCREEVDKLFDKLDETNEELTMEMLNDLKYMEKCIKENLRLYPTAPTFAREIEYPVILDENTVLRKGDIVAASPYFLHRRSEYYENPNEFNPERFSVDNCRNRGLYEYMPFSMGSRNCIGWKMAMLEVKVLAAYILRNFEAHTSNPKDYLVNQFNKCIWPIADVGVRLRRR